ncbi:hypothetical protein QQS21_000602 [Conoideocrella luteorostrata]|uniref:Cyclochlorotine biosynthesis protein O n=1 Tax=Conoideocrella luteorostrata TaxID=1105319 RepID=A0AAJ0D1P2_9HYPO|nr:hypothetical protein QQS21_000602 [Conoideocrella luteorostrata]
MPMQTLRYERLESAEPHRPVARGMPTEVRLPSYLDPTWTRKQARLAFFGNIIILLTSIFILLVSIVWRSSPSEMACAKKVSPYSPIWETIEFWEDNFVNYFNHSTVYRGPPTLERELAWDKLWYNHLISVDAAGVEALNQTQAGRHVEIIGSDPANPRYGAVPEVFHQLHCLNIIRQYTWPLKMFDKSWGRLVPSLGDRVASRMHVDHCIETLRLSLMCYSDITPLLFLYDASSPLGSKIDFNSHHKCRNFSKVVDYVADYGVEIPMDRSKMAGL